MTDNPAAQNIEDSAPIDAEFEPATKQAQESRRLSGAFPLIIGATVTLGLATLVFMSGLIPGLGSDDSAEASIETQLADLQTKYDESETARANLRTTLSAQENAANNTKNAIATLVTRLDRIESSLSSLSAETTDLRETISEIQVIPPSVATDPETGATIGVPVNPLILDRLEKLENALTVFPDAARPSSAETDALTAEVAALRENLAALTEEVGASAAPSVAAISSTAAEDAALALSAIESATRRGRPFLVSHQKLALSLPGDRDVQALGAFASLETPTLTKLQTDFSELTDRALDADAKSKGGSASWLRSMLGNAVTVRRDGELSAADQIERASTALADRDLRTAIEAIEPLSPDVQVVFTDWLQDARQRLALEDALEGLRLTMIAKDR